MGSLCNSNNQTTQSYSPNPAAAGLYGDIISRAQSVASQPYTPYGGELVSPVNAQQNLGISGINAAANQAQPYINTAANYAQQGASAITPGQIANYSNPYQQDVINATLGNINETNAQQQQALKGNAISSGAFGGDRAGIAQAELARQQGLASNQTLAGLNAQNYTQALGAAQADRAAQGQAAYTFGNLGTTAQGAALQGAGAQVQAGNLQQQTGQAQDTAAYQQYLQQLAFPYQQTQFLAGVGMPAASGLGGTQTTTPPQPNPFSQYLGAGLTAASFFLKDGGRVNGYADGGGTPFSLTNLGGIGWIPSVQIQAPQAPKFGNPDKVPASGFPTNQQIGGAMGAMKGLYSKYGGSGPLSLSPDGGGFDPSGVGSFDMGTSGGTGLSGFGGLYARGGLIETVHHLRRSLKGNRYADGGDVLPFLDRAAPVEDAIRAGIMDPQGGDYTAFLPGRDASASIVPTPVSTVRASAPMVPSQAALPPEITAGQSAPGPVAPGVPDDVSAYSGEQPSPMAADAITGGAGVSGAAAPSGGGSGLLSMLGLGNGLSGETRAGLLSAGLGIMAGTSPYGLANIGAGGLKGVEAMKEYRGEQATAAERTRKAQLEGQRLAQQLLLHREDRSTISAADQARIDLQRQAAERAERQFQVGQENRGTLTAEQRAQLDLRRQAAEEQRRQHDMSLKTPVKIGEERNGTPIMALPRLKDSGEIEYYRINRDGTISDAPIGAPAAPPSPTLSPGVVPGSSSALPSAPGNAAQQTRTAALNSGDIVTDAPPPEVRAALPPASPGARDDQFLAKIAETDPGYAKLIKSIADYQASPSQFSLRNNRRERAMGDLMQYDPTYDQRRFNQTNRAITGWAQSPEGRATRSLSTVIEHLGTTEELGQALQNGDVRALNSMKNAIKQQFGYEGPVNFEFAKQIVADEIAKAVIGGQNGEADRRGLQEQISRASSPEQLTGVVRTAKQLMAGQVLGLQHTYETATGLHNFDSWLTPRAKAEIERAAATHAAPAGGGTAASPQNAAALDWANKNPNDPRAAAIKKKLGVQ